MTSRLRGHRPQNRLIAGLEGRRRGRGEELRGTAESCCSRFLSFVVPLNSDFLIIKEL